MSSKTLLAKELGVCRSTLYYKSEKRRKNWKTKCLIEEVLRIHPSYGSRRIALHLKRNRKGIKRVMNLFGLKPYRRRWRKYRKIKIKEQENYQNLLLTTYPAYPNRIWVGDFTYLRFKGKFIYVSTILDLYSRRIVGLEILTKHTTELTKNTLFSALLTNQKPEIFHSDNGSEYKALDFKLISQNLNIQISRSKKGCPWENGYQESFYSNFKIDLADPNRFETLGELVFEIYKTIYNYNHTRIHTSLGMSPVEYLKTHRLGV